MGPDNFESQFSVTKPGIMTLKNSPKIHVQEKKTKKIHSTFAILYNVT